MFKAQTWGVVDKSSLIDKSTGLSPPRKHDGNVMEKDRKSSGINDD